MKLDEYIRLSQLLNIYGGFLTPHQNAVLKQYVYEDYSLFEISEHAGISRQGVRDAVQKASAKLYAYDAVLGLADRINRTNALLDAVLSQASDIKGGRADSIAGTVDEIKELWSYCSED